MPKYSVNVEVNRSYTVDVEADDPGAARKKVEAMELSDIESGPGNYLDTEVYVVAVYDENYEEVLEDMEEYNEN